MIDVKLFVTYRLNEQIKHKNNEIIFQPCQFPKKKLLKCAVWVKYEYCIMYYTKHIIDNENHQPTTNLNLFVKRNNSLFLKCLRENGLAAVLTDEGTGCQLLCPGTVPLPKSHWLAYTDLLLVSLLTSTFGLTHRQLDLNCGKSS